MSLKLSTFAVMTAVGTTFTCVAGAAFYVQSSTAETKKDQACLVKQFKEAGFTVSDNEANRISAMVTGKSAGGLGVTIKIVKGVPTASFHNAVARSLPMAGFLEPAERLADKVFSNCRSKVQPAPQG